MTRLTFLGTSGAWRLPEMGCNCLICKGMRLKKEERMRTALFLSGRKNILIDCGPDIREQLIKNNGPSIHLVYTSDFFDLPDPPPSIFHPDYLILCCYWLNEPFENRANQLSFQRALNFMDLLKPGRETFITHIGDTDMVPGDPANRMSKKFEPDDPLSSPHTGQPYPVPTN